MQGYVTNPDDLTTNLHLMHNQESNQPNSGQNSGCAGLLVAVLGLAFFFPVVAIMVVLLGLFFLCIAYRWAAVLFGLSLAVSCVICAIKILSDPKIDDAFEGILFVPWAGFGLWLAANGLSKNRGLPHDP